MSVQRDNVKAGIFVFIGVILGLVIVFTLSDPDALFRSKQSVTVYFQLEQGLQGLKKGASVRLGDQPIGEVTAIRDVLKGATVVSPADDEPDEGQVVGKLVTVNIPKRVHLYWDANIELSVPTIGTGTALNITSVGSGERYDPQQRAPAAVAQTYPNLPDGAIPGGAPSSSFTKTLGIGRDQRAQIQNIIGNVENITATVRKELPEIAVELKGRLKEAKPVIAKASTLMDDLTDASTGVKAIVADAQDRSKQWFDRIDKVTENADAAVADARAAMARANKLIEDKDPDLRTIVENVRDVSQTAKDKTMVQVTNALEKADAALSDLRDASAEVKTVMVGQRPTIERTLANLQITASQLKLASIEVRRSPWRLIYQPTDKELEYDNVYDAARSFALAAEALSTASQSLQAVSDREAVTDEQLIKMIDHLDELFKRFKDTENRFWEALGDEQPKATPASSGE